MGLSDFFGDRQAEAGAGRAVLSSGAAVETLENPLPVRGADGWTHVVDGYNRFRLALRYG